MRAYQRKGGRVAIVAWVSACVVTIGSTSCSSSGDKARPDETNEPQRTETRRTEPPRAEPPREEPPRADPPRSEPHRAAGAPGPGEEKPRPESPPAPQELVNEEWVIKQGDAHIKVFTLTADANIAIEVTAVKDADKGFSVRIVDEKYGDSCLADPRCLGEAQFAGISTRSYSRTQTLKPGRWKFYVQNSENMLKSMTVKVHVVVNPH